MGKVRWGVLGTADIAWGQTIPGMQQAAAGAANFSEAGIDLNTTAVLSFADGAAANIACGMQLPRGRLDRFRLHGTLGEIVSPVEFNQCGRISYTVSRDGETRTETVDAPNNYRLEVEQMGCCILEGEKPLVSEDFSLANARILDRILAAIGY